MQTNQEKKEGKKMNTYMNYESEMFSVEQNLISTIESQKGLTWKKIKAVFALDCLLHA